jgi:hypothetical protein
MQEDHREDQGTRCRLLLHHGLLTFDGFIILREYLNQHPTLEMKRIFPGIELRMAAPTGFRLNTHVLINDDITDENLPAFVTQLRLAGDEKKRLFRNLREWIGAA